MIHSNKLKRINGEFSRLNLYFLSVRAGRHYSPPERPKPFGRAGNIPIFQDNYALS